MTNDERFFDDAPAGIAGPRHLWLVVDGKVKLVPLTPEHRMRTRVRAEPDFKGKAPMFEALLNRSFAGDKEQLELLRLLFGAALVRRLWKFHIAVLLLGATGSGKSTLLNILRAMFLPDLVGAVTPQRWDNEYYLAGLAGKALNIVGELDAHNPISGGPFKGVLGEDLLTGRHPTHRPFTFVAQAAQFFNSNSLPPTNDRTDAFFDRWRIVRFLHTVPQKDRDRDLAERIVAQEIGAVLAWMLRGAEAADSLLEFPRTKMHDETIERWRNNNNSALAFVNEREACVRDDGGEPTLGSKLYKKYVEWARDNGLRPFGRTGFYEALEQGGLVRIEEGHQTAFVGVRLRTPEDP